MAHWNLKMMSPVNINGREVYLTQFDEDLQTDANGAFNTFELNGTTSTILDLYPQSEYPLLYSGGNTSIDTNKIEAARNHCMQYAAWLQLHFFAVIALLGRMALLFSTLNCFVIGILVNLLSNVDETILYNEAGELTEAAACNVFLVAGGAVATPPLDHQKLPGITRELVLDILRRHSDIAVEERVVHRDELAGADEVWLTSSSKEIAPVTAIDGRPVGSGEVGPVWAAAQALFAAHKFDY